MKQSDSPREIWVIEGESMSTPGDTQCDVQLAMRENGKITNIRKYEAAQHCLAIVPRSGADGADITYEIVGLMDAKFLFDASVALLAMLNEAGVFENVVEHAREVFVGVSTNTPHSHPHDA